MKRLIRMAIQALPMMAMAGERLMEGKQDSPVQVVIYEDLQCRDCAVFRKMLDEKLLPRYADRIAFDFRDFPLTKHEWARQAAIASRHFARSDRKLAMAWRRYALENLSEMTTANFPARLGEFARDHGADPDTAVASLGEPQLAAAVENDLEEGIACGIAKTPTAVVNGQSFIETFTAEEISQAIDAALATVKKPHQN